MCFTPYLLNVADMPTVKNSFTMKLLHCLIYLVAMGVAVFLVGRVFPRKWIHENAFPFNSLPFEKQGEFYNRFHIRKWKTKWPDASVIYHKIFGKLMGKLYPQKRLDEVSSNKIELLIKESCVAESTHVVATILGTYCFGIWQGIGGVVVWTLWALWHLPPILIQRYNRPRLKKALQKILR